MQRLEHAKAIAYNGGSPVMMQDIAYTFDGVCNITDALGGTTQSIYDPLVQLLSSTDPEGFTTNYTTMCSDA